MKVFKDFETTASAAELAHFRGQSPKQQLVTLFRKKHLTKLQVGAISRRMDALVKAGRAPRPSLEQAVGELFSGTLEIGVRKDPDAVTSALTLDELRKKRPDLSKSQELLELRNAGSIAPFQTKQAARCLAQGMTVEQALVQVGAQHLVTNVPAPVQEEAPEPDAEEEDVQSEA